MKLYGKLSTFRLLKKSYALKFLFVAFVGIHIPLIGILFFVLFAKENFTTGSLLVFSLVMTLIATATTLLVLKRLMKPIELASKALKEYRLKRVITDVPVHFPDEAGLLLANIHDSILESESFIDEKQNLIYLLSHDLKSFAGNPQSLAKLIIDSNPSDEVKELAEMICQSTAEQFQYIENFIKILKEQDEIFKITKEVKKVDFNEIIDVVQFQIKQLAVAKNITIVEKLDLKSANLTINTELFTRVVYNLVSNAVKFSFSDSEIEISSYQDTNFVYLKVKDQGIGFESNESHKIFDKFTKMGRLGTLKEASTGIGMYLSKQIIERNNGLITAMSEGKNKGATFTIVFPKI
ncbi:sensor histidine kinase [Flavobacterium sp. MAHUQ-51]|uniref:sensor histidine kinase n=1 Tax=Flavobacterium sp. GCM10022190 TaxID=3252639 RepID=UPI003616621C